MIRLYRAPWSTNVERVALALAHKGLEVESVWIDYSDRSPVEAVSGQGLVPVVEAGGEVVFDSPAILRWLEERHPDPPLFPRDEARRAEVEVLVDWFNLVWKTWPNGIEAELGRDEPDEWLIAEHGASMSEALDRFERLLARRDYLMGDSLGAADCIVFPFVKFALRRDPGDDELFHRILDEHQSVDGRPRLAAWIERIDALPRA
ncbi:MAG: glutathione S-transferase family protein [Actinomycetota bacterium]|nr:glutathione S-transferase family protein [Actinomycetota bacterium]